MKFKLKASEKRVAVSLALLLCASLLLVLSNIVSGYPDVLIKVTGVVVLLISVYLCYVYRYNTGLLLVMLFIAYTNYSIVVGVYWDPSLRPAFMYNQLQGTAALGIGLTCILIFEVLTLLFSYRVIKKPQIISFNSKQFIDNYEYNSIIAFFAPIIYLLIFFSSFSMGTDSIRGSSSALNEYRTIIAIIGSYYAGRKKAYKYIWTIVIGLTSILIMLSGNRIDMFGSMIFLVFYWYADFFTYKRILLFTPAAIIVLAAVGYLRGAFTFASTSFIRSISELLESKFTYDGALFGYMPSLATIELSKTTALSKKLLLLWQHIKYTFTLGVAGSSNPDLSYWSRNYYLHYWGFISPIYFYFWASYLGPVIYAVLVNIYNKLYQKKILLQTHRFKDKAAYILALYFICNVARWYAYGPMALLRSMFVCFVVFIIVYAFDNLSHRNLRRTRR